MKKSLNVLVVTDWVVGYSTGLRKFLKLTSATSIKDSAAWLDRGSSEGRTAPSIYYV